MAFRVLHADPACPMSGVKVAVHRAVTRIHLRRYQDTRIGQRFNDAGSHETLCPLTTPGSSILLAKKNFLTEFSNLSMIFIKVLRNSGTDERPAPSIPNARYLASEFDDR